MQARLDELSPARSRAARLVERFGGAISTALLDPDCRLFALPGIEGLIGYRTAPGVAVAIGDPVCRPDDASALLEGLRSACRHVGCHLTVAVASQQLTDWAIGRGFAAIQWGEELILDPGVDPQQGSSGRELRKKVQRARRCGVSVTEYLAPSSPLALDEPLRFAARDAELERAMERVATEWLGARHGPQIFLARVRLFDPLEGRRWFCAWNLGRPVGVLSLMRLGAHDGYLLDHLLAAPDAPGGTTELLVTAALETLGAEGCRLATFGPAPSERLGRVAGLGGISEAVARAAYAAAGRVFHLDARARYRRKFQVARTEASYLLFDPPQIGWREVLAVLRAFNVSLAPRAPA